MDKYEIIETGLNAVGVAVGLSDIESIIGICLLVVNVVILVVRFGIKLVRKIIDWRNKAKEDGKISSEEIKDLVDIVEDSIDDVNDIKDYIDKNSKK